MVKLTVQHVQPFLLCSSWLRKSKLRVFRHDQMWACTVAASRKTVSSNRQRQLQSERDPEEASPPSWVLFHWGADSFEVQNASIPCDDHPVYGHSVHSVCPEHHLWMDSEVTVVLLQIILNVTQIRDETLGSVVLYIFCSKCHKPLKRINRKCINTVYIKRRCRLCY